MAKIITVDRYPFLSCRDLMRLLQISHYILRTYIWPVLGRVDRYRPSDFLLTVMRYRRGEFVGARPRAQPASRFARHVPYKISLDTKRFSEMNIQLTRWWPNGK